jgi:hypothetical protein
MKSSLLVLTIFVLLFLASSRPAVAETHSPLDALSDAVAAGIDKSLSVMGDSLISHSIGNDTSINSTNSTLERRGKLGNVMFKVLTFDPDFIHNPWAVGIHDMTSMVYIVLFIIYLSFGTSYYILKDSWPELFNEVNWLLDTSVGGSPYTEFLTDVFKSIIFLIGGYYGVYYLVLFANVLTRMIVGSTLDSLAITNVDGIVYFMMALAVFLLTVFVMWRSIVLTIFWAYLLLFLGAYLFRSLRPAVGGLFKYFFLMVFMMFILILIAVAGISFIELLPPVMFNLKVDAYAALVLMLFIAALWMSLGPLWSVVSRAASIILVKKI